VFRRECVEDLEKSGQEGLKVVFFYVGFLDLVKIESWKQKIEIAFLVTSYTNTAGLFAV